MSHQRRPAATPSVWRIDRSDFLAARIATMAVALFGSLLVLHGRIWDWIAGAALTWTSYAESPGPEYPDAQPVPGVSVRYDERLIWQDSDASAGAWLLSMIPDAVTAGALVAGSAMVLLLITRVQQGDPFGGPSIMYVRVLAMIVLGYGLLMPVIRIAVGTILTFGVQAEPAFGFRFDAGDFLPIAIGLVLVLLTEVWRRGGQLRDDVDGLV